MNKQARCHRRRWFCAALVVALVAVAIPVSYAFAGSGSKVTVPVQRYPGNCSYYPKNKVVGKATIERTKSNSLIVTYTLTGANPHDTYYVGVESDSPNPCYFVSIDYLAKIPTDGSGQGSKTFVMPGAGGFTDFWTYSYSNSGDYSRSAFAHV